jgi:microcystin-dependent protein
MDHFMATILLFGGNFAPRGWSFCYGQLLPINQNQALFSLLGTTFGGNGQTTFALPDLRGRVAIGTGTPPGGTMVQLGQIGGTEAVTLGANHMPAHTHPVSSTLPVSSETGRMSSPVGNVLAVSPDEIYVPAASATASAQVSTTVGSAGENQPFSIMQPYLGLNYIICIQGIYPTRE